jgi:hypothetical protein
MGKGVNSGFPSKPHVEGEGSRDRLNYYKNRYSDEKECQPVRAGILVSD